MAESTTRPRTVPAHALLALAALALVVPLLSIAPVFRFFHAWQVSGAAAAVALAALPATALLRRAESGAHPAAWDALIALGYASLAVCVTSQTFNPSRIIAAQANTLPYALLQPVGCGLWVVGGSLIVRGAPGRWEYAAAAAFGTVGATLFLAGTAGSVMHPVLWLLLRSAAFAALLIAVGRRLAPGWAARWLTPLAAFNLVATFVVLGR